MRSAPAALLLLAAACSTAPVSYLVTTPQPTDAVYACALRKVNELGYTVTNTNKDAGFITGVKQTGSGFTQVMTGRHTSDQLTVAIFTDAAGKKTVRATTGQVSKKTNLFGTSEEPAAPSEAGMHDANDLLLACGEGPVSRQGAASFEVSVHAVGEQ